MGDHYSICGFPCTALSLLYALVHDWPFTYVCLFLSYLPQNDFHPWVSEYLLFLCRFQMQDEMACLSHYLRKHKPIYNVYVISIYFLYSNTSVRVYNYTNSLYIYNYCWMNTWDAVSITASDNTSVYSSNSHSLKRSRYALIGTVLQYLLLLYYCLYYSSKLSDCVIKRRSGAEARNYVYNNRRRNFIICN